MKTINLTLLLILFTTSIFGQIPKNAVSIEDKSFNEYFKNNKNIPVVKGKILNLPENEMKETEINYTIVTPFEEFQIKKNCKPNIDGTFELELDYAFPYQQIWLRVGKGFYAGIYANTDLFIELDAEKIKAQNGIQFNGDGVKYLGTDGMLNAYSNNHILFKRNEQLNISRALSELGRDRRMNYDKFILKYDSLYSILMELDNEFIKQNPSGYGWLILNERQSDYYADLCVKHWDKEMSPELFEKIKHHKPYLTSNNGMSFYSYLFQYIAHAVGDQKPDYKGYRTYSKLGQREKAQLDSIVQIEKNKSLNKAYDTTRYLTLVNRANEFLQDTLAVHRILLMTKLFDKTFDPSKSDMFKIRLSSKDPHEQKLMMEAVLTNVQTEWCKEVIQKQYNILLSKLAAIEKILSESKTFDSNIQLGQPVAQMPSGAKLYKIDSMDYEALLANLKTANKDKAIIIDFWATWCGPCIHEMPYSKKLQDETKDLPVEFVYLCTSSGSDVDKWKSKIAEFEIGGTHIYVEQAIESKLMALFSVNGFPSYVLIDKKGDYKAGAISRISMLDKQKLKELID